MSTLGNSVTCDTNWPSGAVFRALSGGQILGWRQGMRVLFLSAVLRDLSKNKGIKGGEAGGSSGRLTRTREQDREFHRRGEQERAVSATGTRFRGSVFTWKPQCPRALIPLLEKANLQQTRRREEGAFMKRCISSSRSMAVAAIAATCLLATGSVVAQTVDQVLQAGQQRLNLAQQSQERINGIVEGTRSLEDQYRAINKEIDGLRVYNRLMEAQTQGQAAVLEDRALAQPNAP